MQIRFALLAVAQNVQLVWIPFQLPHKVDDVTVRVALAQNRYKPKDVRGDSKRLAVSRDHSFACQLRGRVKRSLHRKWRVFRRRNYLPFAVNGTGGREHD